MPQNARRRRVTLLGPRDDPGNLRPGPGQAADGHRRLTHQATPAVLLDDAVADLDRPGLIRRPVETDVADHFTGLAQDDLEHAPLTVAAIPGGLGLPERDYYFRTDAKSVETRKEYVAHVSRMLQLTGVPAAEWAAPATTVMCCLSKGLCAPVGSLLAGSEDVITEARLARKRLGGGMRQAGVLAAPGLIALQDMVGRLPEDHARAARLADAVALRWPACGLDPASVRTNIVVFTHAEPEKLLAHLEGHGVLAHAIAPETVRFVTHHDVDDAGVTRAIAALEDAP